MTPLEPFTEPIVFGPLFQIRVWGGRHLETIFHRPLPDADQPYGESWEISDRPEAESRVMSGPAQLIGRTLGELWREPNEALRTALFGPGAPGIGPFPLLCKILDARERLSLQVHPPKSIAEKLGGEPKSEMWVVARAEPGAELFVGLREGVTRGDLAAALDNGTAEDLVHRIPAKPGDFLFVPSGRLHAIGAGLVIYEIQQNSDTTYRVYDWNRIGLDGQPRPLQIGEALMCIDFDDVAPALGEPRGHLLVECESFRVERHRNSVIALPETSPAIVTVVEGRIRADHAGPFFGEGDSFLMPAQWAGPKRLVAEKESATVLVTTWP